MYDHIESLLRANWINEDVISDLRDEMDAEIKAIIMKQLTETESINTNFYVDRNGELSPECLEENRIEAMMYDLRNRNLVEEIGGDSDGYSFATTGWRLTPSGVRWLGISPFEYQLIQESCALGTSIRVLLCALQHDAPIYHAYRMVDGKKRYKTDNNISDWHEWSAPQADGAKKLSMGQALELMNKYADCVIEVMSE